MSRSRQFGIEINRLVSVFGDKAFGPEKLRRIEFFLSRIPDHGLTEIVDNILDGARYAPTPNEIREAASAWRRANVESAPQTITVQRIQCLDCYETGFIHCRLNKQEPETLVFCHCEFGERNQGDRSTHMPRWQPETFGAVYGFIKLPFPMQKFVPATDADKKRALSGFGTGGVAWRNQLVANANLYWDAKANRSNAPIPNSNEPNGRGE